jgi:hypothetical protein
MDHGRAIWEYRTVSCPVQKARVLWDAWERGGVQALRPLVTADLEWEPWGATGALRGYDGLVAWSAAQSGDAVPTVTAHSWEAHGDCALTRGSLRVYRGNGFIDVQPSWVWFFRGDHLVRAASFASREEALAAIARHQG